MLPDASRDLPGYVLDSYAVLAFLGGEDGQTEVTSLLRQALRGRCRLFMSVVSLGEFTYVTERERGLTRVHEVLARLDELPIKVVDVDHTITLEAAHIKTHWPLAYADCFVAALAKAEGAALVTGDPEFSLPESASVVAVAWLPGGGV